MNNTLWVSIVWEHVSFVRMLQALGELNLITWIGDQMKEFIKSIDKDQRLTIAIVIIVWVSALVSSFIDNIPYTTAMVSIQINVRVLRIHWSTFSFGTWEIIQTF